MSESAPEVVPESTQPDAPVGTGNGGVRAAAPAPEQGASTSGLGTQASQQGGSAEGGASYQQSGHDDSTEPRSPSGT